MQIVIIKGLYRGNEVSGTFETNGKSMFPTIPTEQGDGKVHAVINGNDRMVWVNRGDFYYEGEGSDRLNENTAAFSEPKVEAEKTDEELRDGINKRFSVMNKMATGVIHGTIRSLIISGAPGIGKTYTLERRLERAANEGRIKYSAVRGKCSPIGLYMKLYEMRNEKDVLVLDDVDVFSNEDYLNVLKAALDTSEKRIITWGTASTYLEDADIPTEFEFKGSVIFITNADIASEIERGTKIAPHLSALQSRSIYLDLGVHTNREIMVRVEDVIRNTRMMQKRGLSPSQTELALAYLKDNVNRLRSVSLRTALYLADFIRTDVHDWVDIADVTLLKN